MTGLTPIALDHGGVALEGQIASPDGDGPHPAVLVMSNAHGLGPQARETAIKLAGLGYIALATDMYGGGAHAADQQDAGRLLEPLWRAPDLMRARTIGWFEELRGHLGVDPARIAAIGYCFGGQCVLELARSGADVVLVVSYHGILKTASPAEPGGVRALVSVHNGVRDPYAPPEDVAAFRAEMTVAGARWQLTDYGEAAHGFTDPAMRQPEAGIAYEPVAAATSWAATLCLLDLMRAGK